MRFEDLNWMDVESYLKTDDRLILVLGSCEQHGYLSLACDTLIPSAIADAASERSGVPVAPALGFGVSPYFADYPGTISLRAQVYLQVVEDIVRAVFRQGFRGLLVLNGHGGNSVVSATLYELATEMPDLRLRWLPWWKMPQVEEIENKHSLSGTHADWSEAFPFTRVAPLPEGEKPEVDAGGIMNAQAARRHFGDGSFGGKYQVDEAVMQELFDAAVAGVLEELERLKPPGRDNKT